MRLRDLYNAAGWLTLSRLGFAAGLPLLVHSRWLVWGYALALLTDVVDGPVARRLHHDSRAGAAFDAWVDKALHVNLAWALAVADVIPDRWMWLWFTRELIQGPLVFVLVGRFRRGLGPRPHTSPWGRATSIVLAATVFWVLLGRDATVLTWSVAALGTIAGLEYASVHLPRPTAAAPAGS